MYAFMVTHRATYHESWVNVIDGTVKFGKMTAHALKTMDDATALEILEDLLASAWSENFSFSIVGVSL